MEDEMIENDIMKKELIEKIMESQTTEKDVIDSDITKEGAMNKALIEVSLRMIA